MKDNFEEFFSRSRTIADAIKGYSRVHIVTHIDADGLTAGAIAAKTLERAGIEYTIDYAKQLDEDMVEKLSKEGHELVWFTDLGSGLSSKMVELGIDFVITDHHEPEQSHDEIKGQKHLNPHHYEIDGANAISGSGVTYLVSREMNLVNRDLAGIAIIGACGDLQDARDCRLTGINREIMENGRSAGVLDWKLDLRYFGRQTRPLYKLLQYSNDPIIPGITGREPEAVKFLEDLGIRLKEGTENGNERWRSWIDLSHEEKRTIISAITKLLLSKGFGHVNAKRLLGEIYTLRQEEVGSELRDTKEFATLLNSTARYGNPDVGLRVCLGERGEVFKSARALLLGHRKNLVEGMQVVEEEGIIEMEHLQYFHSKDYIRDTIVGIVTGMMLNSENVRCDLPLIGLAHREDGDTKVSARTTRDLVSRGIDLAKALRAAASKVEGMGGGHDIAAGATVPKEKEQEFLRILDGLLASQIKGE